MNLTPKIHRLGTRLPAMLLSLSLILVIGWGEAFGCPTCKDGLAHDAATANMARGYGMSIMFMMSMPFLILGGLLSYFYWEIKKAQAALDRQKELQAQQVLDASTNELDCSLEKHRQLAEEESMEMATTDES